MAPKNQRFVVVENEFTSEELDNRFNYHKPDQSKAMKHEIVRARCRDLARDLVDVCPPSRDLSIAIARLEETMFWANAAIARND